MPACAAVRGADLQANDSWSENWAAIDKSVLDTSYRKNSTRLLELSRRFVIFAAFQEDLISTLSVET
jgi:hypothetical protein